MRVLTIVFVFTRCFQLCVPGYVECWECDHQITDIINDFRANLICSTGILNITPVINSDVIFHDETADSITTNSMIITHESCDPKFKINDTSLVVSVTNFIRSCAARALNHTNQKYSWFWNPKTRRIQCLYSEHPFSIRCNANGVQINNVSSVFHVDTAVVAGVEEDYNKITHSHMSNSEMLKIPHDWLKTCNLRLVIQQNIQNEINTLRQNLVLEKNISNMPFLHWSTELQIVASEFGKIWANNDQCKASLKCDNVHLFYLPLHISVFNYDGYINPVAGTKTRVRLEIENGPRNAAKPPYFWMYDTTVTSFGCVFQMRNRVYDYLVCAYNNDLQNNVLSNFKYGPPCSSCPEFYSCDNSQYNSTLCSRNDKQSFIERHYKSYFIFGVLLSLGIVIFCIVQFLKNRTTANEVLYNKMIPFNKIKR